MCKRHAPLALGIALLIAGPLGSGQALAQPTPTTGEIPVNTETLNHQVSPATAGLSGGGFVVVWESLLQDGDLGGIFAQRFDGAGARVGGEFRVNATTAGHQDVPAVAALPGGGFVAAWASAVQDGADADVYARRFDGSGSPLGGDVRVNSVTDDDQAAPSVAALAGGGFVVAWASDAQDGSGYGVYAQRYDAAGAQTGPEFRVNTVTAFAQTEPSVGALADGGFVVAWTSSDGSLTDVWAQRYDAAGAAAGGAFRVNTYVPNNQAQPSVAGGSDGGFVVAWASLIQDHNGWGVYVQRYTAAGAPVGAEFGANTVVTLNNQWLPSVAGLTAGAFVVAWASNLQDGSGYGVYARRYDGAGTPDGGEFRVNTHTEGPQTDPSVGALSGGGLAVAWESDLQDGGLYGVYARVYGGSTTAGEPGPTQSSEVGVSVRPNPSSGPVEVTVTLMEASPVRVAVVDALGREVAVVLRDVLAAGPHEVALDASRLAPGAYFLRLETASGVATRPLTVVR